MRRKGKALGQRTNQTVRYIHHCSHQRSLQYHWSACPSHSDDILDFLYRELKRLGRNCCRSRLEFIELSRKVLEKDKPRLRLRGFRCIRTRQLRRPCFQVKKKSQRHAKWQAVQKDLEEQLYALVF